VVLQNKIINIHNRKKSPLIYHGVMLMKTEKRSTPPAGGGRCVEYAVKSITLKKIYN